MNYGTRLIIPALMIYGCLHSFAAQSQDLIWPSGCATLLQDCIDDANSGDWIAIDTETPINEPIFISNKDLRLTAAPGVTPSFASGRGLSAFNSMTSFDFSISGLGFSDGDLRIDYSGTGNASVEVSNNRFSGDRIGTEVSISNGSADVVINGNVMTGRNTSFNSGLIEVEGRDATVSAKITHNKIQSIATPGESFDDGWGIVVQAKTAAVIDASIGFNEVRGRFSRSAIGLSEGLFSSTPATLNGEIHSNLMICRAQRGTGFGVSLGDGTIDAQLINNTITSCGGGTSFARWSSSDGGGQITGNLLNNLVAFNDRGIFLNPEFQTTVSNSFNLVHGNNSNQYIPGSNTLTSDPLLLSVRHPWLQNGSPAINTGNALAPLLQALAGLDVLDAAGLRRRKGSQVDIGAYEYGDIAAEHIASSGNASGQITQLGSKVSTSNGAEIFVTPRFETTPGISWPLGVFLDLGPQWSIFAQDFTTIRSGQTFNLWNPATGNGAFTHVSDPSNISAWSTRIDDASLNNGPNRFVLVNQNWTAGGNGIYNAHPVGMFYFGGSWFVTNTDQISGDDMAANLGFNIYSQDLSPNAFRVIANAGNRSGQALILDHPLLNGTRCALPQVTRISNGSRFDTGFDLRYSESRDRWLILHQSVPQMPLGSEYAVLIDPEQVHRCAGELFSDGFEA